MINMKVCMQETNYKVVYLID